MCVSSWMVFFFFNDAAPPEIYTFPLPAPLPSPGQSSDLRRWVAGRVVERLFVHAFDRRTRRPCGVGGGGRPAARRGRRGLDRKSTRLNSSHANISYAVFCLKKKTSSTSRLSHHR